MKKMKMKEQIQNLLETKKEMSFNQIAVELNAQLPTVSKAIKSADSTFAIRREREGRSYVSYASLKSGIEETAVESQESPELSQIQESEIDAQGSRTISETISSEIEEESIEIAKKDRIAEILSTQKPTDSKNRKQGTDYYLKSLIIKSIEKYYQQFDKNIKISF